MQHTPDGEGVGPDIGTAFADPAFAVLKARGAPFAILRPESGEVLWANAAAAAHWDAIDAEDLSRALFGADGRGGWLSGLARGPVSGPAEAQTAVVRAWTDEVGRTLIGLAVPDVAPDPGSDAWRRPAWSRTAPAAAAEPSRGEGDAEALARRSHLAVLRDRLGRALDGATALRLLWRTDASGALVSVEVGLLARLGSPLHPGAEPWPDAVARYDPVGAEGLRAALASRTSWSGVSVDLPVADGAAVVPMTLGASPVLGPGRAFAGFRGFGTLHLDRIALAQRPAPAGEVARPADEPAEAPPVPALPASAPPLAAAAPEGGPEGPPGAQDPRQEPVVSEAPRHPANVVQLRAFQGAAPAGSAGAPRPPLAADAAMQAGSPEMADGPESRPAEVEDLRSAEQPLDDQSAFLALGEALRARIAAPAAAAALESVPESDAPREPAPREPAAALLDGLPIPVLATVGDRPIYGNAAAAARLGFVDAGSLLEGVEILSADIDRIVIADGEGGERAAAARRVEIAWADGPAVLWLLSDTEQAVDAPSSSSEEPTAELFDRIDDAVALLDAAGRVRRLNRHGEGWFARPGAEPTLGRSFAELLAPESRPAALALLGEVRSRRDGLAGPPLRREVAVRTGEEAPTPMILTLGRLGDAGFYATLRDVTALKRAESDRDRTERDRARAAGRLPDLLAKVSHEIRTPLGSVLGFAEIMMDERFGPLGNPRYKDYLRDIHAAGTQVVALVDDLLDLSRIEAGQIDLAVAAVDLNRVVAETVAQMQPEAHRERVIMRTSLGGRVPAASADERAARQIVRNLLSNAVKFNEPGGQVIVSTAPGEGGGVLLRVRDTGIGMTDEEIASALEPFGGLPARAPAQGNGLGLPLTRALVGANGASMTIRSRPREGTLVEVAFAPAQTDEARQPA